MKGIGVDIVEFERIERVLKKEKFVDKILSDAEKNVYYDLKNEKRKMEYLAGRFAIKEAIYKAASNVCQGMSFSDFSILNDSAGAPYLAAPNISSLMISLSHSKNYVIAFVVFL